MTPDHRAKLEQAAGEWLVKHGLLPPGISACDWQRKIDVMAALADLLATRHAAVLEEVAAHWERVGVVRAKTYGKLASKEMAEMGKIRNEETANFVVWCRQ